MCPTLFFFCCFTLGPLTFGSFEEFKGMILMLNIMVQATIACVNTWEFFTPMELEEGGGQFVDLNIDVQNVLTTMLAMPSLFKSLTNFSLIEFEELAHFVVPAIIGHVRSIGEPHHISKRLSNWPQTSY